MDYNVETLKDKIIHAINAMDSWEIAKEIAENSLHDYYAKTYLLYHIEDDEIIVESLSSNSVFHPKYANKIIILEMWYFSRYSDFDWAHDPNFMLTCKEINTMDDDESVVEFLGEDEWKERVKFEYAEIIQDFLIYDNEIIRNLDWIIEENNE